MLISIRQIYIFYIGKIDVSNKIPRAHNSGIGSQTSHPVYFRPYSVFAYICGFNGNQSLMYCIEHKWKYNVRRLISRGIKNPLIWLRIGGNESLNLDLSNFGIS